MRVVSDRTRARISAAGMGNTRAAKWGHAHRIHPNEPLVLIKQVGRLIRDERLRQDIPQSEIAAATGICEQTLVRIEQGSTRRNHNRGMRLDTLVRIALALGVRPSELMP